MEKNKETKRFDLMEFGSALGREEMKKLMAGSQGGLECENVGCLVEVTCPNGWYMCCSSSSGLCYSEGDGTCDGYINCNTGAIQDACWIKDPGCHHP
ncbi:MAG: hypothetical protein WDZ29_07190 [Balneolaceae bacterium]